MANWDTIGTIITIAGGIGVGTVAAGFITAQGSKSSTLSQLRQSWIDALRSDLVDYLRAADALHENANLRDAAMKTYRRVLLRLNLRERRHVRLQRRLVALLDAQPNETYRRNVEIALTPSRLVLKREWEVTKGITWRKAVNWLRQTSRRTFRRAKRIVTAWVRQYGPVLQAKFRRPS
jgi:hypothetical protein